MGKQGILCLRLIHDAKRSRVRLGRRRRGPCEVGEEEAGFPRQLNQLYTYKSNVALLCSMHFLRSRNYIALSSEESSGRISLWKDSSSADCAKAMTYLKRSTRAVCSCQTEYTTSPKTSNYAKAV